ncbi:metallophosphoesterase [Pectinatus haikarae]|uniref:metallophosphoesterase n=2 Tax=Pectinatus haikarae TaxID=349096 RepID=UPI0018C7CE2C|nr:metallophosphoesterase [Pectinatus haikarae]
MFMIFLTCVFAVLIIFSVLSARLIRQLYPRIGRNNIYFRVLLFNIFLLAALFCSKFIPGESTVISVFQQFFIIVFVTEIFFSAFALIVNCIIKIYDIITDASVDLSRRNFLMKSALVPIEGMVLYGSLIEKNDVVLNKYDIKVHNAGAWKDIKIAQLTDVHIGSYFSIDKLRVTMDRLAALNPDILAVTGDIFDDDKINAEAIALIGQYCGKFRYGIYYCWGNHEYMRNMTAIKKNLAKTDIHVLTNESIIINRGDDKLSVIGVDYPQDRERFAMLGETYMKNALNGVPSDSVKILLAHHSDFIDNAFANHIDLALTGHTHGGQLGIFGHPLFPGFKYVRGMFIQDSCYGYVSTGAGSWFPFRIGCPPEITIFTLV